LLGWRILRDGEYRIELPRLSSEEEKMILAVEERFKQGSRERKPSGREECLEMLKEHLTRHADENGVILESDQTEYLTKMAYFHIYGCGFIEQLLSDNDIEEISVIGIEKPVYVFIRNEGWKNVNACFTEERAIADVVNKMSRELGRRITVQNPRLDAMLPNGSRLHASLPPISSGEMTIRKFREKPFSPYELEKTGTISGEALAYLSLTMHGDNSAIIAGNTASGKTTTMNALFSFVPANERIIITEETPEINIPHKQQVKLVANKEIGISLKELVYDSLRMRPDRMIVGEVRNKDEAEALFDVLLSGQARGSYATFHAQSSQEVIQRLNSMGINEIDMNSLDLIVVQRRMLLYDIGKRRNSEVRRICEITEINEGKLETIYALDRKTGILKKVGKSRILEKTAENFDVDRDGIMKEMEKRRKIISKKQEYLEFFKEFQKVFYGIDYV